MRPASAVVVVMFACGCGPASHVDSNATLSVVGLAERQNGGGAAAAKVQLVRHPDALQALGEAITIVGSLGLACIAGNDSLCHPYAQATTGSDGRYTFAHIRGADTQGSTGEALLFSAWLTGPAPDAPATAPAGVDADFYIQNTQVTIPPLRLWENVGTEDDASGAPSFSWHPLESAIGSAANDYRLQITTSKGQVIWSAAAPGSSTQVSIDARVTQDFFGSWSIWAHRKLAGEGTDFDLTWYSPALAFTSKGHLPLSRGKGCWIEGADGPMPPSPCPLTDGDLATSLRPLPPPPCPTGQSCTPAPQNHWVTIDLEMATAVSVLVLYDVAFGSASSAMVEGSLDGTSWTSLAAAVSNRPYQVVPLSGTARYVRLRLATDSAQFPAFGNSELAIF